MTNFAINFNNDFFSSVGKDATIGGKNGNGFDALLAKVLQEGINLTNDSTQLQTNNDNATFNLTLPENPEVILPTINSKLITNTAPIQSVLMPVISQKAVITPETAEKLAALAVITALNIRLQSNNPVTPVSLKAALESEDNIENNIKNISFAGKPIENIANNEIPFALPNEPIQILNPTSKSTTTNNESMVSFDNRTDDEVREEIKSTIRQVLNKLNLSPSQPMDQVKIITDSPDIKLRESLFAIDDNGTIQIANSTPFSQPVTEPTPVTLQNKTNNNSKYEQKIEVIFSNIDAAESANNSPTGLTSQYTGQKVTNLVVNSYTANNSNEHVVPTEFVQTLNTERNINIENTSLNATTVNTSSINAVKKQSNSIPIVPLDNNETLSSPTAIIVETILPASNTRNAKSNILNNNLNLNNLNQEIVNPVVIESNHPLNTIEDALINNESVHTDINNSGKIADNKSNLLPVTINNSEPLNKPIVNINNNESIPSINPKQTDMLHVQDIQINTVNSQVRNNILKDVNNQIAPFNNETIIQLSNIQENNPNVNTGMKTIEDNVISNSIPVETKTEHPLVSQLINNSFSSVNTSNTPVENIKINTGNISQQQHVENLEEINPVMSSQISTNQVTSTVSSLIPNVAGESVAKQLMQINNEVESNVVPSGIIAKSIINENNTSNIENPNNAINKVVTNNISVQTSDVTADSIPVIIPALIPNMQPAVTPTHISNKSTTKENIPVEEKPVLNDSGNTVKLQPEYNRNQVATDTKIESSNNTHSIVTEKLGSSLNKIAQPVITTSIPVNTNLNEQTPLTTTVSSSVPFITNEVQSSNIVSTPSIIKPALKNKEDITESITDNKAPALNIAQPKIAVVENEVMPVVQPVATVTVKNTTLVNTDHKAPTLNIAQPKVAVVEKEVLPVVQPVTTTTVKNTELVITDNKAPSSNIAQPKIAVVENEVVPVTQPVATVTVKNTEPVITENQAPSSNIAQPKIAVVENEVVPVTQPLATVTVKNIATVITDNKAPSLNISQPKIAVVENEVMPVEQPVATVTVKNTEPVITDNKASALNIPQSKIAVVENEIMPVAPSIATATIKNTEPVITDNKAPALNIAQPKIAVVENEVMPVTQPVATVAAKNTESVITDNKAPVLNIAQPKVAVVENDVMLVVQPVATVTVKNTEPVITENQAPVSNIAQLRIAVVENEIMPVAPSIATATIKNTEPVITDNKAPALNIAQPKVAVVENEVVPVVPSIATSTIKNTEPVITDNKAPALNIAQLKVAVVENEVVPVVQPGIIHNSEETVTSVENLTQSITNVQSKSANTTMMATTPFHTDNAPLNNEIASTTEIITTGKSDSGAMRTNANIDISTQTTVSSPAIVSANKNVENFTKVKSIENNPTLKTERINTKSDVKETITTVASPVVEENDNIINMPVTANIIPSLVVTQQVNSQPVIPEKISNIPIILSSNKQQTPVQPTAITVDVSVANGQSDARNNTTKSSENKISNNSMQNIIINDNSQIVTEVPIADNKMAVVQRLQQMLNNTLAQAVQIIQTIPMKSQAIQQPMILTSDFINKAELFTENDNITMQETQRPILSLDEPIMGIKSSKNFFNHLSALTDKLITTMPQQEKLTKSAPVISQVIAADNSNTFKIESKEQNTEKNMQLSAILSNNTVNNMQKNDDNNSKVVNVNPSRIIEQIAKNVQPIKKDGKHEIILRLDPPTLGEIRVRISSDQNGIVTANIEAVHSSVRDSLAARVPELRQALQDAGLSLDKCQVSLSNDRSFNNQFTNQSGNGRWQNDNRQQTNGQEAFIPLPDLSPDNTEMKMPETATMNYLV